MSMKVSREEFLGIDKPLKPSFENVAAKMALDFEAGVFLRLKELGLKRKDLARLLGVSPAAISKMLTEDSNLTLRSMAKIAAALGCEISPIHLSGIAEVGYVDLGDGEALTAHVPREPLSDHLLDAIHERSFVTFGHMQAQTPADAKVTLAEDGWMIAA